MRREKMSHLNLITQIHIYDNHEYPMQTLFLLRLTKIIDNIRNFSRMKRNNDSESITFSFFVYFSKPLRNGFWTADEEMCHYLHLQPIHCTVIISFNVALASVNSTHAALEY